MALCLFAFSTSVAFGGDQKVQAPAASKAQAPAKGQESAPLGKIVTQTTITKKYVPVQKHRRLVFRQLGASKVETCTNCVSCPNCNQK
jgi:hypothetical protein